MPIDFGQPLEPQVRREIVAQALQKAGYDLSGQRIERIAQGMGELMGEGWPAPEAFAEAMGAELLLNGDPLTRFKVAGGA